jgi:predicted RNA binding protein YcfA (HicA-like mRNA interferase family)
VSPSELPVLKPRELIRALERMGFRLLGKSKGSHWQFEHPGGAGRLFPSTKVGTSAPTCCGRSCRTLKWTQRS